MAKIDKVQEVAIADLKPYPNNAKKHGVEQVELISRSIEEFGFISPILIDENRNIIAGHWRLEAAKELGMETVPCIYIEGLSEEQYKAYILADNKLTELGEWDMDMVKAELSFLDDMDFDISITGFELDLDEFEDIDTENLGSVKNVEHTFAIDREKYPITEEEYDLLTNAFQEYLDKNGISYGFIKEVFG